MAVETCLRRAPAILFLAPAGKRDEGSALRIGPRTDSAGYFVPVHAGHANVEQRHPRMEFVERVERSFAIVHHAYVSTQRLQQNPEAVRRILIVVDDQNALRLADRGRGVDGGGRRLRLAVAQGDSNGKPATLTGPFTLCGKAAAMQLGETARERQSDPEPLLRGYVVR